MENDDNNRIEQKVVVNGKYKISVYASEEVNVKGDDYVYSNHFKTFGCKPPHCLICKYCDNVIIDWDGSPYMWNCSLDKHTDDCHNCKQFELKDNAITLEEYLERNSK